jgi:hypothetical protein
MGFEPTTFWMPSSSSQSQIIPKGLEFTGRRREHPEQVRRLALEREVAERVDTSSWWACGRSRVQKKALCE